MDKDPLELDSRRSIYEYVRDHPGTYVREIMTHLTMPQGQVNYHLDTLEERGLVVSRKEEYHKRYFLAGAVPKELRGMVRFLQARVPRAALLSLLAEPGLQHGALAQRIGVAPPTLTYHMKRLAAKGLVERHQEGGEVRYRVPDPQLVVDAMVAFRGSLVDDAVDRFLAAWVPMDPRAARKPEPAPGASSEDRTTGGE